MKGGTRLATWIEGIKRMDKLAQDEAGWKKVEGLESQRRKNNAEQDRTRKNKEEQV